MDEFRGCEEGWTRDIMAEVCFYARMKTTREKYRDSDILNTTTIPKPHPTHPTPLTPSPPFFPTSTTSQPSNASKQRLTQNPQLPSKLSNHQNPSPPKRHSTPNASTKPQPNPTTSQPQPTKPISRTHRKLPGFPVPPKKTPRSERKKSCGLTIERKSKERKPFAPDFYHCKPSQPPPPPPPKRKVGSTSTTHPTPSRAGECVSCQVGETEGVVGKRGRGVSLFGWGGRRKRRGRR